jgi:HK97 family phage prohead protease
MMIQKVVAGKRPNTLTYVLSDATIDRFGDTIDPAGWQLTNFKQNPIALFNHNPNAPIGKWKNVRVENDQLIADLAPADPGTSARVDEILSLIRQDVLRATSVGFRSLESAPIDPKNPFGGTKYTSQELVETSIVSVPANPAALAIARSMNISDETLSLAFGGHALTKRDAATGGHASAPPPSSPRTAPMNLSSQIQDTQTKLNGARDALVEHVKDPEHDVDQAETMHGEIALHEQRLTSLQQTERALAARTAQQAVIAQPATQRRPLGLAAKEVEPRDLIARAAAVHLISYVQRKSLDEVLHERYPDHEATGIVTKAAVAGATTTTVGWAAELAQQAQGDFLANLDPSAIFPRLSPLGTALTFGPGSASIKIPSRATTPSIGGSFVAEGAPIPVRRLGLTSIILIPHKVGVISAFSREIAQYSNPAIEGIIRAGIADDTAINIDGLLLDAVAESTTRPAGLTNGVAGITAATGGGYGAILKDIKALSAPFYAVNAGRNLVLLLNPSNALELSMAPGPDGTFGWSGQFTNRFTVLESTNVPVNHVYMIDAADFVSVSGTPEFDVSEVATLHMEDTTPLNIGTAGAPATIAAPTQSMFQTGQVAIRMLANVTWAMRRTGMVQHIVTVNWV